MKSKTIFLSLLLYGLFLLACQKPIEVEKKPNVVFIFADEWRAQDLGYMGNPDVKTPHIDKLANQSVNIRNAIAGASVCSPYRASLLTGQYPLTHGVFVNDVLLNPEAETIGKVFKAGGYETGYIGKWHLDGHGRENFIPKERRQGFDYWKVLECTHDYYESWYWNNEDEKKKWDGYDAYSQTRDAIAYIEDRKNSDKPFFLVISWGPPHTPFFPVPEEFEALYRDKDLRVRPNVPEGRIERTKRDLIGYYSHISALDQCIGELRDAITKAGMDENTIFVFTSDHGHMVNSHGQYDKQKPYEESIHVPFLIRYPALLGDKGRDTDMLLNTPDIMPTLLSLCKLPIPVSVEGDDLSKIITGEIDDYTEAVLISCPHPFGQWHRGRGGKEYRGVRTKQYTYARDLNGPWLLYDNKKDPYQTSNLIGDDGMASVKKELEGHLERLLAKTNDDFLPGMDYIKKWNYVVDHNQTIPYREMNFRGEPIQQALN
jgi:arylsulfatase A-like enzyme